MRARLIITMALWLCTTFGVASADDFDDEFDDNFGKAPAPAKPPPSAPPVPRPPAPKPTQAPPAVVPPPPPARPMPAPSAPAAPAQPPADLEAPTPAAPVSARPPVPDTSGSSTSEPAEPYPPLDDAPVPRAPHTGLARRYTFVHPNIEGLIGGVHTVDARSAAPGTFRVALQGRYFRRNGFIARGDGHRQGGALLALNLSPIEHLELAAHLATLSTENATTDPRVIQVLGDTHLFAKGHTLLLPWLSVAGDLELALLNGLGSLGVAGRATSVGLRASTTADLRELPKNSLPLLARFNLGYVFDNSAKLVRDLERARFASLGDAAAGGDEFRHLVTPAERYALQISRVDRLTFSFGLEAPFTPQQGLHVSPMLEWAFALPVNRQGFDCVATRIDGDPDRCLAREGFSARPSVFSLGVRAQPFVRGLGVLLAVDIATTGQRAFVREFAPQSRYMLHAGLSYAYDPRPPPPRRARIQRVEIPANSMRGHIAGQLVEAQTGSPVASAVVHFEDTSLSDVVSDERGVFRSAELPPGAQGMRIRADGYREALCVAVLPTTGADVGARCELTPSAQYGAVEGRVIDASGNAVAGARIVLTPAPELEGASEQELTSDAQGNFTAPRVVAGAYQVQVYKNGYLTAGLPMRVEHRGAARLSSVLYRRPSAPLVQRTPKRILLRRPISFVGDSAVLTTESLGVLAEAAELLRQDRAITRVEVQGHVDAVGEQGQAQAQLLSEQRAEAVRSWLINAGVESERLIAIGYGATRPVAPNITSQNRARNRRIELSLK